MWQALEAEALFTEQIYRDEVTGLEIGASAAETSARRPPKPKRLPPATPAI